MKIRKFELIILTLVLSISNLAVYAQNYGDDPTRCNNELSNYTEYYKQKQYKDAYPSWSWCYKNCPESIINIYVQGPNIIETFIKTEEDSLKREQWIDTLLQVFDNRIKYFGQEGLVLGKKALAMVNYRNTDMQATYEVLKKSFDLQKEASEYYILGLLFKTTAILYQDSIFSKELVLTNYADVTDALNAQLKTDLSEKRRKQVENELMSVEDVFVNSGVADCETIIKMYEPKYAEDTSNLELAKKIIDLLNIGNSDECKLSDLYLKTATFVYENDKSASSAHSIAQSCLKRKEYALAEKFYNEAIALEEDTKKKADMYHELALVYYVSNNYPSAKTALKTAIICDETCGKSYVLLAKIYASGAKACANNDFEKKVANCLAVDWLIKAKNADPSVAGEANELTYRYSAGFPKREEGFWLNIDAGSVVSFGCWINESTTVRFVD